MQPVPLCKCRLCNAQTPKQGDKEAEISLFVIHSSEGPLVLQFVTGTISANGSIHLYSRLTWLLQLCLHLQYFSGSWGQFLFSRWCLACLTGDGLLSLHWPPLATWEPLLWDPRLAPHKGRLRPLPWFQSTTLPRPAGGLDLTEVWGLQENNSSETDTLCQPSAVTAPTCLGWKWAFGIIYQSHIWSQTPGLGLLSCFRPRLQR